MAAASSAAMGLGVSPLRLNSTSGLLKPQVSAVGWNSKTCSSSSRGKKITCSFQRNWLRADYNVIGFGLIGWLAPSSIPAINGNSLTGLFFQSIGEELAHFPTGPALTSQFWINAGSIQDSLNKYAESNLDHLRAR